MEVVTSGASMSLVSENIRIEGELGGEENILINGRVVGSIKLNGDIVIGQSGLVEADIEGDTVVIQGTVKGNVTARHHLEIQATGKLIGDITARSIDIKEGSTFEGRSRMLKSGRTEPTPVAPLTTPQASAATAESR
ncbi:MAG: polymer-forming cytoskeletal protein [Deltaproteobacteria bacterium]|nr:polymer-forming cytoskeletal protein [Deltaproteobacteria bacterium]